MSHEVVLITGASSGIGRELAKLFAADGSELILVARSEDKLEELAKSLHQQHGTESTILPADLSVPGAAQRLFEDVKATGKDVDVLINNAGFGQFSKFDAMDLDRLTAMCELNVIALTQLSRLFLPSMLERNRGGLLNIGSTASFQPGPNSAVYYATKAFVLSFSEAVCAELWGKQVSVTCLCPGPTKTGFGEDSKMGQLAFFKKSAMDVETVARAGYNGFRKNKRLIVPGLTNKLLAFSNRLTARPIVLGFVKMIQPIHDR